MIKSHAQENADEAADGLTGAAALSCYKQLASVV